MKRVLSGLLIIIAFAGGIYCGYLAYNRYFTEDFSITTIVNIFNK